MKKPFLILALVLPATAGLKAQVTVVPPAPPTVEVVREAVPLDYEVTRQRLSVAPQVVVVPGASSSVTVVPEAATDTVKTTKTTTVVQTASEPARVYNSERSVVVVQDQSGERRELPYVTLPVLFVKETDELLGEESHRALEQIAGIILAISKTEAGTLFDIEGHTSTDGTDEFNMELSAARAKRVYEELTQKYGVPPQVLSAHGYGESFPRYPDGTEEQMQLDRRVLVVRAR